jgi:ATP-dependent RNA helicase DHX8/PRP22
MGAAPNPWCFDNFVQARSLRRAQDVRKQVPWPGRRGGGRRSWGRGRLFLGGLCLQLITIMDRYKLAVVSAGKNYTRIRKAICSGFFAHAAKVAPQEGYTTLVEQQTVYIRRGPSPSTWKAGAEGERDSGEPVTGPRAPLLLPIQQEP